MIPILILSNIFTSALFSIITVPVYYPPLDSVEDLIGAIRQNTHSIWFVKDFPAIDIFVNSAYDNEDLHEIGEKING